MRIKPIKDMEKIIAKLYENAPKELKGKIDHCDCGCCEEIDFRILKNIDRQNIDFEVIGRYADKAITTIGTVEDYKYFLPRIAEMVLEDEMRSSISFCLLSKLELGKFWTWEKGLKESICKLLIMLIDLSKQRELMDNDEMEETKKLLLREENFQK